MWRAAAAAVVVKGVTTDDEENWKRCSADCIERHLGCEYQHLWMERLAERGWVDAGE